MSDEFVLVRSLALLQITAACIAFGGALLITARGVDAQGLIITALAAALFGAALLRVPGLAGARWAPAAGILSTLLISLYIYFGGEPALPFALFYAVAAGATVWCATIRATVVQVAAMVLLCSAAVWMSPEPDQQPWPALAAADLGALVMLCIALSALTALIWRFKRRYIEGDRRAALLVEFSRDAIIGVDGEGTITTWNHGAEALYEYKRPEALGRNISLLFPDIRGDELATLRRVLAGEVIEGKRVERFTRDGSARKISLSLSPITDAHGVVSGAVGINRDVTAEVLAKERMATAGGHDRRGRGRRDRDRRSRSHQLLERRRRAAVRTPRRRPFSASPIETLVRSGQEPALAHIREARGSGEPLEGELDAVGSRGEEIPIYFRTRRLPAGEGGGGHRGDDGGRRHQRAPRSAGRLTAPHAGAAGDRRPRPPRTSRRVVRGAVRRAQPASWFVSCQPMTRCCSNAARRMTPS